MLLEAIGLKRKAGTKGRKPCFGQFPSLYSCKLENLCSSCNSNSPGFSAFFPPSAVTGNGASSGNRLADAIYSFPRNSTLGTHTCTHVETHTQTHWSISIQSIKRKKKKNFSFSRDKKKSARFFCATIL